MSDAKDSNNQSDPKKIKGERRRSTSKYLGMIASGLILPLLQVWNSERERASDKQQQRADERLIADATNKMARYTGWLVAATIASVATAALTLLVIYRQSETEEATQRAFLVFGLPQVDPFGGNLRFGVRFTNMGNTGAYNVVERTSCAKDDNAPPNPRVIKLSVGPKQELAGQNCIINGFFSPTAEPQSFHMHILQQVQYTDVFGVKHLTEDCRSTDVKFPVPREGQISLDMCVGRMARQTCADYDCPKDDWDFAR